MSETQTRTKIEEAIYDTKLRLEKVKQDIMLLSVKRDALQEQLVSLETIRDKR